ncbi:hypothetical protein CEXT_563521 [Caerostris extrusa]|uniref:Uncharacterized protein n=1 Tax=Caerostris extrusa TaxID=172846 RepID=A0AAV4Y100_CAEEX|nr:hypothetical protein CEXT_563521 [Caerostris extrusa]
MVRSSSHPIPSAWLFQQHHTESSIVWRFRFEKRGDCDATSSAGERGGGITWFLGAHHTLRRRRDLVYLGRWLKLKISKTIFIQLFLFFSF